MLQEQQYAVRLHTNLLDERLLGAHCYISFSDECERVHLHNLEA